VASVLKTEAVPLTFDCAPDGGEPVGPLLLAGPWPKTGRPKGMTSHHSMSLTVLPELELVETYRLEIPPSVRDPIVLE
jgi:hypothetical protein